MYSFLFVTAMLFLLVQIIGYFSKKESQAYKAKYGNERLVAYVNRGSGKIYMWPERIDPEYALNCLGATRMPHLDEPKVTSE